MKNQAVPVQGDFCWIEGVLYDNRAEKQIPVTDKNLEVNRFCKEILNSCLGDNVAGISFEVDPETDDCVIICIDKKFEWVPARKCIFFHWGADETISRYIAVLNHREGTREDIDYFQRQVPTKYPEAASMIYPIFDAVKNSMIWKTPITIEVCYNTDSQQIENITIYR